MTQAERREVASRLGLPGYRADQVARHWLGHLSTDPGTWTDIAGADRDRLVAALLPRLLTEVASRTGDSGQTRKTAWRLHDGAVIESVLMRYPDRATVCVSTQAGCGMGCTFCATGQMGLRRNLSAAEIVEQVLAAARVLSAGEDPGDKRARVSNVVLMGMGEPLANYDATVRALRLLSEPVPRGFGISARSLTVSTVGIVPRIDRLAGEGLPVTLAISLHAPDDRLRNELVPVNRRWPVESVLAAADRFLRTTGRRVSIEYTLIAGVNDSPEQAEALGRLLAGRRTHVNLIPLNPTAGSELRPSDRPVHERFLDVLRAHAVAVTVRDSRGRDIDAACGQLAGITRSGAGPGG